MIKKVCLIDCNGKNSYKSFRHGSDVTSKIQSYLGNFSSVLHNYPYQKSRWKVHVPVNVVTTPELKMVCGKSNEINGKKNCFVFNLYEKFVCF